MRVLNRSLVLGLRAWVLGLFLVTKTKNPRPKTLLAGLDPVLPHPRPQDLGHDDRAVGLLVVLHHGDQAAADGDGGAVERVDEAASPFRP